MNIALMSHDNKKELMVQFCTAYAGILSQHQIYATNTTGHMVADATGLKIERVQPGTMGGWEQIASRIAFDEIDVLFYFRAANPYKERDVNARMDIEQNLLRLCDVHNVPVATNIATAEIIVTALDRGELDYRNFINPRSEYNVKKRNLKY